MHETVDIALRGASFSVASILRDVRVALRVGRLSLLPGVLIAQGGPDGIQNPLWTHPDIALSEGSRIKLFIKRNGTRRANLLKSKAPARVPSENNRIAILP